MSVDQISNYGVTVKWKHLYLSKSFLYSQITHLAKKFPQQRDFYLLDSSLSHRVLIYDNQII